MHSPSANQDPHFIRGSNFSFVSKALPHGRKCDVLPPSGDGWALTVNADRATLPASICGRRERERGEWQLTKMLSRPDLIEGY